MQHTFARFQPWIRLTLTIALALIAVACGDDDGASTAPGY